MGEPITWRNVVGAQPAEASRPLVYATQALNDGFAQLGKVIDQRQAVDAANWEAQKQSNTQAFLDKLAQYRTPQELAAAQASGELDALRTSFGAQIDRAQVRNAAENRMATVIENVKRQQDFNDWQQNQDFKPVRETYAKALFSGDTQTQKVLEQSYPGMLTPELYKAARDIGHENLVWDRDAQKFVLDKQMTQQNIAESKSRISNAAANLKLNERRINLEEANAKLSNGLRVVDAFDKTAEKMRTLGSQTIGSQEGRMAVIDGLTKAIPDKDKRQLLMTALGPVLTDPQNQNLSVADVMSAAMGTVDNTDHMWGFGWRESTGDGLDKAIKALRNQPTSTARAASELASRSQLEEQLRAIRSLPGWGAPSAAVPAALQPAQPAPQAPATPPAAPQLAAALPATPSNVLPPAAPNVNLSLLTPTAAPATPDAWLTRAAATAAARDSVAEQSRLADAAKAQQAADAAQQIKAEARQFLAQAPSSDQYRALLERSGVSGAALDKLVSTHEQRLKEALKKAK